MIRARQRPPSLSELFELNPDTSLEATAVAMYDQNTSIPTVAADVTDEMAR